MMTQSERVVIVDAAASLDSSEVRAQLDLSGCGSVVSFLGVTRDMESGAQVEYLEFDAWQSELPKVLRRLGEEAVEKFGVSSVAMAHRTGRVRRGEEIVAIHVASPHRAQGFEACRWLIDELKAQAPLWKKEVTSEGEVWKEGLG